LLLALSALLIGVSPGYAHKIMIRQTVEKEQVYIEVFYQGENDDGASGDIKVTVVDKDGELIHQGQVTEKGTVTFPRPKPGKYQVTATDTGHRARTTLTIPEPGEEAEAPPSREEMNKIPWLEISIGISIILLLAVGARYFLRKRTT
jgi:hypothetical protein